MSEWKIPNDTAAECCKKILNNMDFILGGAFFECPKCHRRMDMSESNKYTKEGLKDKNMTQQRIQEQPKIQYKIFHDDCFF